MWVKLRICSRWLQGGREQKDGCPAAHGGLGAVGGPVRGAASSGVRAGQAGPAAPLQLLEGLPHLLPLFLKYPMNNQDLHFHRMS